jgi:UDP-2,3-diacylglucosamine hydrolase
MHFNNKKIYFASDQHFGAPTALSLPREKRFVAWLDDKGCEAIFLVVIYLILVRI